MEDALLSAPTPDGHLPELSDRAGVLDNNEGEDSRLSALYQPDPSDLISLDPWLLVEGSTLTDGLTGRIIELSENGAQVAALLNGRPLAKILEGTCELGIGDRSVTAMVSYLARDGLISVRRPLDLRTLTRGVIPARRRSQAPSRRYPTTFVGTLAAAIRVSWVSMVLACLVPLLLLAPTSSQLSSLDAISEAWPIALLVFVISATAVLSVALHEFGHIVMMRKKRVPHSALLRRGWRLSLRFRRPSDRRTRQQVAIAGPLLGAAAAVPGGTAAIALEVGLFTSMALYGIGLIHLLNLLPFFADGRELWLVEAPHG